MKKVIISMISLFGAMQSCTAPKQNMSAEAKILISTGDRAYDLTQLTLPAQKEAEVQAVKVRFSPEQRFQQVYGFGSAITGSACYNLMQMPAELRDKFLEKTFSPDYYGHSYVRVPIGCSDFSLSEYTLCDQEGLEHFAFTEEETKYIVPILQQIKKINPALQIIGSPWTPPRWMKVSDLNTLKPHNEWTSGHLNPKYYATYAEYLSKWIETMEKLGLPVTSITIQNEPLNRKNSASMYMGWEEQRDFIKTALSKTFKEKGLSTKVYLFDHNYNYDNLPAEQDYPARIYEDTDVKSFVTGAAYHNYGGHSDELKDIHQKYPDKELIFTETSIGEWNEGRNLNRRLVEDMEELGIRTLNNHCRAVLVWNLMLDEKGAPYRELGCKTCFGAVDIQSSDYKTMTKNSHYYVLSHLSKVIKPNATRIAFEMDTNDDLMGTAFQNPDQSIAFVMLNKGKTEQTIDVEIGGNHYVIKAPKNSVLSFLF